MKTMQSALRLNELLDRPLIVSFNFTLAFSELRHMRLDGFVSMKRV